MSAQNDRDGRRLATQVVCERASIVTLTANASSTTIVNPLIRFDSFVGLMPTTAAAAAEVANGTLWISETGRVNGSVVISHANGPSTDRTFRYFLA